MNWCWKTSEISILTNVKKNIIIRLTNIYLYVNLFVNNVRGAYCCYYIYAAIKRIEHFLCGMLGHFLIIRMAMKKVIITLIFMFSLPVLNAHALIPIADSELNTITAQSGISIILENLNVTYAPGLLAIGGTDGLGIPAAPDGAYFVFSSNRIIDLNVEKGAFNIDAFTNGTSDYMVGDQIAVPANTSAALIDFGAAYFHINLSESLMTLKFANNAQGNNGDGITEFSKTVCDFALNGAVITIKTNDAKMFVYPH